MQRSHPHIPLNSRRTIQLPDMTSWLCGLMIVGLAGSTSAETTKPTAGCEENPTHSFAIPAWAFDRGNAQTFTKEWADAGPMVAFGGESPVFVVYEIEFPNATDYRLRVQYAAADKRPVVLSVDGRMITNVCRSATGSWNTSGAGWEESALFRLTAGKHTLRLERASAFPHVMNLRFDSALPLPTGWVVNRPKARKLSDPAPAPTLTLHEPGVNLPALRRAIEDLARTFGESYRDGPRFFARLAELESAVAAQEDVRQKFIALQREALLANPLLDFKDVLLVKRRAKSPSLGLPQNWESNCSLPRSGYDDELCVWSRNDADAEPRTVFKPGRKFIGDVDLHWDADRVLFSMPGTNGRWQVFELALQPGASPRQLTGEQPDVDSYDACYLPNGKVAFTSTAMFVGVPCVNGSAHVANLYVMDADGRNIRQLCFDQEHNWCPTVMNDGRVLYARWEYADTPHSNSRMLFTMNPDGTSQAAYLGSGSYWPNSFFYARPIPNHPTKVVAVIGGHHDHPRMGELVVFDPQQGRLEGEPAVQRIPGFGKKVEPLIRDGLTLESWPKFLHPWPLSEKYFLVAGKPSPRAPWGIYLADVFDNLLPLKQLPDFALLEPIPLRKTTRPPVIPERVNPARTDAIVVLQDVYGGEGMRGVPRGTVKALRLFTYHYAYQGMGGLLGVVGMDGPWDIKRVLGTVPVEADGSARFRVPANMPISIQPLDAEGKALQLMRSWMTAMPGETVQCTGCHDRQNSAPPANSFLAMGKPPSDITPWRGPVRGFSFAREVQPVIDRNCVSCHDGKPQPDGSTPPNLRGDVKLADWSSVTPGNGGYAKTAGKFSVGYAALHRYVRRPGIESDFHVLEPLEFHADTTQLVQMLKQGHYGVQLDAEAWDRLVTWIDLNTPYHGTWGEEIASPGKQRERRRDLLKRYANLDDDSEAVPVAAGASKRGPAEHQRTTHAETQAAAHAGTLPTVPGWPFGAAEAKRRQTASGPSDKRHLELSPGISLELMRVPAGEFLMGSQDGPPDEQPVSRVRIAEAFWMAQCEINNAQFACFNPAHDSRVEDKNTYQFGIHGYPANEPSQPVVRVSWQEAMAFCHWLAARTGLHFTLPTEAQWEWACRAGAATPFNFGPRDTDFSGHANFADAKLREFASDPYTVDKPLADATPYDDWIPKDTRFNDGALLAVAPGRYAPNAWGLQDMHGNVAEWTRSSYAPYPWATDGRDDGSTTGRKVVRGGSWRDVPARGTASFRLSYQPWQRVYNVGFRVVCEGEWKGTATTVSTAGAGHGQGVSAK
ncbi:MAG: SUMF1/EgtB/PvdO family nonheme iron enzyme [Verrucomicrobia bacterium]|nr:SUMF1/EgtB/PvdO family nonheme iron enzyme [Verrucomicrobiota bacterium]